MRRARIMMISTPIGTLGSGLGGGVELTVVNTARVLRRRGHEVTVVAAEGSIAEGVSLITVPGDPPPSAQHQSRTTPILMPAWNLLANMCESARRLQRHYDVIVNYAYDWLPLYLTPFFVTPLVHVVGMGSLTDAFDRAMQGALANRPGGIAVHTRAQADTFPFGDQLRVIGNGIDLDRYQFQPQPAHQLGWVARISPEKGLEDAAAAAAAAEIPLHVWGVVEDWDHWSEVRSRFPASVLRYRGFVPTERLQGELGRCRALLVTPRWVEAFGNVVGEALACGVPVITYRRGGPAELVADGRTGFVVDPDSVSGLVSAIGRLDEIDRAACRRHAAAHFSLDALGDRLEEWLEPFVGG